MENNYLIEKGYEAYNSKVTHKAGTYFILTVVLSISVIVLLSAVLVKQREIDAKNYQLEQREILINSLTATNNELTHDNIILSNGK